MAVNETILESKASIRARVESETSRKSTGALMLTAIKPKIYFYIDESLNFCHVWYAILYLEYLPCIILSAKNYMAHEFDKHVFDYLNKDHDISYYDDGNYTSIYDVPYEEYSKNFHWITERLYFHQYGEDNNNENGTEYYNILTSLEDYAYSILKDDNP